jgi:hypothetical protein
MNRRILVAAGGKHSIVVGGLDCFERAERRQIKKATHRALRRTEAQEIAEQLEDYQSSGYRFIEGPPMRRRRKAVRPVFEHVEGSVFAVTYEEAAQ